MLNMDLFNSLYWIPQKNSINTYYLIEIVENINATLTADFDQEILMNYF